MKKLSLVGVFSAIALGAACSRPAQSAADTATATSTTSQVATPAVDTVATTTTEVTTSSSTVRRKSSGKKASGSTTRKTGTSNSVRSTDPAAKDSVLGRDSVIRFPIRRLPTASSTPVKR